MATSTRSAASAPVRLSRRSGSHTEPRSVRPQAVGAVCGDGRSSTPDVCTAPAPQVAAMHRSATSSREPRAIAAGRSCAGTLHGGSVRPLRQVSNPTRLCACAECARLSGDKRIAMALPAALDVCSPASPSGGPALVDDETEALCVPGVTLLVGEDTQGAAGTVHVTTRCGQPPASLAPALTRARPPGAWCGSRPRPRARQAAASASSAS